VLSDASCISPESVPIFKSTPAIAIRCRVHTASPSHATIKASYGLLKAEVEMPLRSSNVLLAADILLADCRWMTGCILSARGAESLWYLCTCILWELRVSLNQSMASTPYRFLT
jgi:hypothetical protein